MKNILVLCTGNSCRSQMAQGYLQFFVKDRASVYSAGVEVHGVNPAAVFYMKEDGIDISLHTSNQIEEYRELVFDYVITVCDHAKEVCPYFPAKAAIIHHNFEDPSKTKGTEEEIAASFRQVRNQIKEFCRTFMIQHRI